MGRRLRVVVLSGKAWHRARESFDPGEAPDPSRLQRLLAEQGIDFKCLDPLPRPLNPFARSNSFYAGIDPIRALMVLIYHRDADLVISVFESGAIILVLLRKLFRFKPKLALWDASVGNSWRPKQLALRLVLPRIDRLFALTRWQARAAESRYQLRETADVIGYAVDETFYHPKFNQSSEVVLTVGEDAARDYGTFIAAVKDLPTRILLKTSSAVEIPDHPNASITFERSFLTATQLRDLYAKASIFVLPLRPSDNPSGITALFEAMAMGKAIVASDVPMTREFLVQDETALLVPVGDAVAMRNAIVHLLASPETRARLGTAARAHLAASHGMAAFADRYATRLRACVTSAVPRFPANDLLQPT